MKEFKNKVAVVTGAASGIGRGLAERFALEGMKVVLADIEEPALRQTEQDLQSQGATVLAVPTNVASAESVDALARATMQTFGAVHIVCNNAGVAAPPGPIWERTLSDWEWVLGVNLWGVIHGIRAFTPLLLQSGEGHIVNTASIAGLLCHPFMSVYNSSKHAVVAITETMHAELTLLQAPVKVSVLCPGFVQTRIAESERNRPTSLTGEPSSPQAAQVVEEIKTLLATGLPPAEVASQVIEAIRDERLYILTHPEYNDQIRLHAEFQIEQSSPKVENSERSLTAVK